jgi:hypothetical protein
MRRNASTVVVLVGPVPDEVLAAVSRSMNVALVQPEDPADPGGDAMEPAAGALRRAGRTSSPYALVPADPLAGLAASWQAMWDVSRQHDPAVFELEAAKVLAAWRAARFELPDYYMVLAGEANDHGPETRRSPAGTDTHLAPQVPDFYLGPLRSSRPHRVAVVAATKPAQQATGVLQALGSLRHGPWWPDLADVVETARRFYPGSLAEASPAP